MNYIKDIEDYIALEIDVLKQLDAAEINAAHKNHPVARLRVALTGGFWGVRMPEARGFIPAITVAVTLGCDLLYCTFASQRFQHQLRNCS